MLVLKEKLLELQERLAERERGEVERKHAVKYRKVRGLVCVCVDEWVSAIAEMHVCMHGPYSSTDHIITPNHNSRSASSRRASSCAASSRPKRPWLRHPRRRRGGSRRATSGCWRIWRCVSCVLLVLMVLGAGPSMDWSVNGLVD